jgi:hypothetical protein
MSENNALDILKIMEDQRQSIPIFDSDNMTLSDLMKTLQELIEKYPFIKDYPIVHEEFGSITKSMEVTLWNKKIVIT